MLPSSQNGIKMARLVPHGKSFGHLLKGNCLRGMFLLRTVTVTVKVSSLWMLSMTKDALELFIHLFSKLIYHDNRFLKC